MGTGFLSSPIRFNDIGLKHFPANRTFNKLQNPRFIATDNPTKSSLGHTWRTVFSNRLSTKFADDFNGRHDDDPSLSMSNVRLSHYTTSEPIATYNLGVEEAENYFANGFLVHNCSSCMKLAGKVKRGSFWQASGIQPQHPGLRCGGWNCQCFLSPTTDRASAGRLPSIP